ncbi:ComEA family DNA-binding protein [Cesiribacter andamanensis]|uniref:ComEA protein n=1 Tax=Cesiribacter andamanensis AMV16 TaxID=1279009 RepID=M7NAU2_9BACT|nr:helix-hairpin-helix domain-containing protein [Cesiribacter andamanensis]EMR04286.1 comEA protein [Cesiribacter andamanensis AMV16]
MRHGIERFVRNFFGFSRMEARSFIVVAAGVVLLMLALLVYRLLPASPYQPQADQQQLDSLMALLDAQKSIEVPPAAALAQPDLGEAEHQRFVFDPNRVSLDSLLALGVPQPLAQRLLNYRSKGGVFRKKEDLRKLYGLPEALYLQLEPYIQIPPPAPRQATYTTAREGERTRPEPRPAWPERKEVAPFNLNEADSLQLQAIRGIGPVLSARIIKFREALGGFVAAEQVRDVYGIPPEVADALLEKAYLPPSPQLRLLAINQADESQLASHPYISRRQAGWIVAYRRQHGPYQQAEDLLMIHQLDAEFIRKIAPYLTFTTP